jgi:hypothetical protein
MNLLLGHAFPRYSDYFASDRPPLDTSASPRFVKTVSDNRDWLLKLDEDSGPQEIIGEAFCWLFGREFGVKIPEAAIYANGARRGWVSELVPAIQNWSPEFRDQIINLDEVGKMLALDAIVGNPDRHGGNVLVDFQPDEAHVQLWAIDHGYAMVADAVQFRQLGLDAPEPHRDSPNLPYEVLRAPAMAAAQAMSVCNGSLLTRYVAEAWACVDRAPPSSIAELLIKRCKVAADIVDRYLKKLGEMT